MTIEAPAQAQRHADGATAAARTHLRQAQPPADAATAMPFVDVLRLLAETTGAGCDTDPGLDETPVQTFPPAGAGVEPGFPAMEAVPPAAAARAEDAEAPGASVHPPVPVFVPMPEATASPPADAGPQAAPRAVAAVPATPRRSPDPTPVMPAAGTVGASPPASAQRLGAAAANAVDRLRTAVGLDGEATAAASEPRAGSPGAQAPAAALMPDRSVAGGEAAPAVRGAGAPHGQTPLQQALGERLRVEIGRTREQATVRLDPPSLGRIEILVRHEGAVLQVHLSASNGDVARQLGPVVEQLRQDLAQRHPGEVTVTVNDGSRDSDARQRGALPGNEDEIPHRALDEGGDEAPASRFALAERNRST